MIHPFQGMVPKVDPAAFIAPGVHLIGDVEIGPESNIWFNAVLRGDANYIRVGRGVSIQDLTMVHADPGAFHCIIGDDVLIGHSAIIHGCIIKDNVLVGMGSKILNGAVIEENCLIGANTLITEGKRIPAGSVVLGAPGKVVRQCTDDDLKLIRRGVQVYQKRGQEYKRYLAR